MVLKRALAAFAAVALLAASAGAHAAAIRIVAFGDSATKGYLVAPRDSYPAQLQAALRAKGYDAVVRNEGRNGETAAAALRRFDMAIDPDTQIAIVEFGTNDLRRTPRKAVGARIAEIVRSLRARGIQVLVIGLGRLDLSALAKANDALYVQWRLPPGQYRARDRAHFNAQGYAILIRRMMPAVETLIARVTGPR